VPGRRAMLITAGPTHEPLDAVRYLANRSSGQLGLCLAEAARDAGWRTTLLLGPIARPPPTDVQTLRFESTADLARLLEKHFSLCDVLIMAAAVADYRPRQVMDGKRPRTGQKWLLELEPTPDLLAACSARRRPGQRIVGFALEDQPSLDQRARQKLQAKGLDAIVASPLETMGSDQIRPVILTRAGHKIVPQLGTLTATTPPAAGGAAYLLTKRAFATWLIEWIERQWFSPPTTTGGPDASGCRA